MIARALAVGLVSAIAASAGARAELIETSASGFTIRHVFAVDAPPYKAYGAFIDVGRWWNPEHSYSGEPANFWLVATAEGCFCETWEGGAVKHAEVVQAFPDKSMRWIGALGPLQDMGLSSVHDWTFEADETGTVVTYVNRVRGWPGDDLEALAPIVDAVQVDQMQRLERYINTDSPDESD